MLLGEPAFVVIIGPLANWLLELSTPIVQLSKLSWLLSAGDVAKAQVVSMAKNLISLPTIPANRPRVVELAGLSATTMDFIEGAA
jgi:hypothetical protein